MSETAAVPESFAAQVGEAMESASAAPTVAKAKTKTITFRGRTWLIPAKPSADFLYHLESNHFMHAAEAVLGDAQFADLRALRLDADELDGLFDACNKAWGLSGN